MSFNFMLLCNNCEEKKGGGRKERKKEEERTKKEEKRTHIRALARLHARTHARTHAHILSTAHDSCTCIWNSGKLRTAVIPKSFPYGVFGNKYYVLFQATAAGVVCTDRVTAHFDGVGPSCLFSYGVADCTPKALSEHRRKYLTSRAME